MSQPQTRPQRAGRHNRSQDPWVASGFEPVRDRFYNILERPEERGAALCIYRHGQLLVDLWGGHLDPNQKTEWQNYTMVSTFSACKAMTALCLLHLVDQGHATLDDKVIAHWPEFARVDTEAKSQVSLRHLLQHSAGLPTTRTNRPGDVFNWSSMVSALERAPLLWPTETRTAYHAVTFGHLVGELVRRVSGQMPSEYFASHFAAPLGLDYTLRFLPRNFSRTAQCDGYDWKTWLKCCVFTRAAPLFGDWRAQYFRPCGGDYHPNGKRWQNSEAPAITGFGTAEALARVYAMLAAGGTLDGQHILSEKIWQHIARQPAEPVKDLGTGHQVRIGLGMFFNLGPVAELGPNPNSFGHYGMGGTTSFADPDRGIGFGYVCSHLYQPDGKSPSIIGDRGSELAETFYHCLKDTNLL